MEDFSAELPEEAKGLLNMVSSSARQMNRLIDDLLHFSRLGRQRLSKERVNLAGLVCHVLEELRREDPDRLISIQVSDLPDCVGDGPLLKASLCKPAFKCIQVHKPQGERLRRSGLPSTEWRNHLFCTRQWRWF